jgi:murein tripeptide amidase MpaA
MAASLSLTTLAGGSALAVEPVAEFPVGFEGYHTYEELSAEVATVAAAHPEIVRLFSMGRSYEGRELWAVTVSDNPQVNEDEPEVLIDAAQHSREPMSTEMALYVLHELVDGYGVDPRVTTLVNSRETHIVFMVNPDGVTWDIRDGAFHHWRKNRQPTPGTDKIGTDINRNYDYQWGLRGSGADPGSYTFRGPSPFSAPESAAMRDFVLSREVDGRQQIRMVLSFHVHGRKVLWPYGYTSVDTPPDMTLQDTAALRSHARAMGALNGYSATQSGDWYLMSGVWRDWLYGRNRVFGWTFELGATRYPDDAMIAVETSRNREAVLHLIEHADCPYRITGRQTLNCGPFFDDLEIDRGWVANPAGTDTATEGMLERATPQRSGATVARQLTLSNGSFDLVTGATAGGTEDEGDLDGLTSIRSPAIRLTGDGPFRLRFRYYFSHGPQSSAADHLRVFVVSGGSAEMVFQELGHPVDDAAAWSSASIDLSRFAGQEIRLKIEAVDAGNDDVVEAAVDWVRVTRE